MSLLTHITTRDLMDRHNDLLRDSFPNEYLQNGTDGVITGTTVPCTFTSASLQLYHYIPDHEGEIDKDLQKVKLLADNTDFVLPVLNIPRVGFFRITGITDNQTCTIDYMTPSVQLIINRGLGLDLDATTITAATGLAWSLGGKEEKIALAYCDLVTDLIKRNAITAESLNDDDPSYVQALSYKSLELTFTALMKESGDNASILANRYYHLYKSELEIAKPYGYIHRAVQEFVRC